MGFAPIDWAIVGIYLAASLAVGLAGKRYVGGISSYLVAGRELGLYLGIATLAATEIGTITFMYNAELGYKYGFAAFSTALISGVVMIIVGRTGFIVKKFRELKLMTVPEYFQRRYSLGLRLVTGILVALGGILNMGVFLKIEGEFLTIISGIAARYLILVMTIILLLEVVYTMLGGMVSVVITDFFQYALLSVATVVVSIYAVHSAGWHRITDAVTHTMGLGGYSPFANLQFGWKFLIWQALLWFSIHTCWQTTAMRMFSTKSPETSKRVMTWTGFIFLGRGMLPMLWGIAAFAMFGIGARVGGVPAPVINGHTLAPIDAMPTMLSVILAPGIKGIVVAGMLAATMSVNSSYLLGWSSILSQDVVQPLRKLMRQARSGFEEANPAESDREFICEFVSDVLGFVLHTSGGCVFVSECHRNNFSCGSLCERCGRIVLETRNYDGRLSGNDSWRGGRDHSIFLFALERNYGGILRVWIRGGGVADGIAAWAAR